MLFRKFKLKLGEENVKIALSDLAAISLFIEPLERVSIVREDPDDNKILECAIAAKADFIITGDSHLLKLENFKSIKIVTANEFLKLSKG